MRSNGCIIPAIYVATNEATPHFTEYNVFYSLVIQDGFKKSNYNTLHHSILFLTILILIIHLDIYVFFAELFGIENIEIYLLLIL